jgi:NADP-dependent 3-hydroxy acid dehydrogenase YdfG
MSKTILITGAASGFGKIAAFELAKRVGIPLKLTRRSAAIWKCVPPIFGTNSNSSYLKSP